MHTSFDTDVIWSSSREFEREILPMAREFGMALAPWSASGGGRLNSKKQVSVEYLLLW
jgi:aryl-alcohol dehydrogenase-like predicted oxidoreductase